MFQISAQESRRKKKEYMDTLEKRMELLNNEVDTFRQRCSFLEQQNGALQMQLQKLQAQLSAAAVTTSSSKSFSTPANKTSLAVSLHLIKVWAVHPKNETTYWRIHLSFFCSNYLICRQMFTCEKGLSLAEFKIEKKFARNNSIKLF